MSASAITTLVKMVESLPDPLQDQVIERLREYLEDLKDELHWDEQFQKTQGWLANEAKRVRSEVAAGKSELMDLDRL